MFFVDLPCAETRAGIFRIHLAKRDLDPARFELEGLAAATDGFTGAEIEEVVVSARYLATARGDRSGPLGANTPETTICDQLTTEDLLASVHRTYPMSVTHAETISALRTWARDRTVPA